MDAKFRMPVWLAVCLARARTHSFTHTLTHSRSHSHSHSHSHVRARTVPPTDRSIDRWQESLATSGIPEYLRIVLKPVVDVILSGADPLTASRADLLFQVRQRQVGIGAKWESGLSGNPG